MYGFNKKSRILTKIDGNVETYHAWFPMNIKNRVNDGLSLFVFSDDETCCVVIYKHIFIAVIAIFSLKRFKWLYYGYINQVDEVRKTKSTQSVCN